MEALALATPVTNAAGPLPQRGQYLVLSGSLTVGPERASDEQKRLLRRLWRAGVGAWPIQVSSPSFELLSSVLQKSRPHEASQAGGSGKPPPGW